MIEVSERRLRVGVVGAGMIAQVEHIPNLMFLSDRFELVAVADPSAQVRAAIAARYGINTHADLAGLMNETLDALVIAVPDPLHADTVLAGLEAGLHVFCEKPLCFTEREAAAIIERRDSRGLVVQIGYMKRFDPNFEAMLDLLPPGGAGLRYISVEVNDPDSWPFVAHRPLVRPDDVPAELIADSRARQRAQAAEALGVEVDGDLLRGFCDPLMSGMIHSVNSVNGMLDRMGIEVGEVLSGEIWSGGQSAGGSVSLMGGEAVWRLAQVFAPDIAWYRERYTLHFTDRTIELQFPAPYLNNQQTDLWVRRSNGLRLETTHIQAGYGEAFVRELEGFWESVVDGAEVRNPVEDGIRDACLMAGIANAAIARVSR